MRLIQTVLPNQHGVTLGNFLEEILGDAERVFVRNLLREGRVRVNGLPELHSRPLRAGDHVEIRLKIPLEEVPRHRARPERRLPVLHSDERCVVVDKPAGLVTVPDRTGEETGVHGMLESLFPGEDLRIVHRLDRDTSGCLILAKGASAAAWFDLAFRERRIAKHYLAIVKGVMRQDLLEVDKAIAPDERNPLRRVAVRRDDPRGKAASTSLRVLERFENATLVEATPATGRTHQVRLHLASAGHPLLVDPDYGGKAAFFLSDIKPDYRAKPGVPERPLVARLTLHAERIRFEQPDGSPVEVSSPIPKDLEHALRKLRKFAPLGGRTYDHWEDDR
jgi:RluA family pseudouridine synthase